MSDDFFPFSDHDRKKKHIKEYVSHYSRSHKEDNRLYNDDYDRYPRNRGHRSHDGFDMDRLMPSIEKITHNKTLLVLLALGVIAALAACVVLLITFFPLILRLIDYVFGGGLKGIIDLIQPILAIFGGGE
jgi:hypothetical protein